MSRIYDIGADAVPPRFTDMLGQEVRIGDTVAYAVRQGNTAELKVAQVLELVWHEKMSGGYWTWKVQAAWQSWYGDRAVPITGRPSSPTRGRAVRIAKGDNW